MGGLTVLEVWIVGPSAMGSVKGTPSSIMSAGESQSLACVKREAQDSPDPPFSMARRMLGVASTVGKPAVT